MMNAGGDLPLADRVRALHITWNKNVANAIDKVAGNQKVQAFVKHPRVKQAWRVSQEYKLFDAFCRTLIGLYFLNMAYYSIDLYFNYNFDGNESLDFFSFLRVPFAVAFMFNYKPHITGPALAVFSAWDTLVIFKGQLSRWFSGHNVAVTELMVKKLAIFGSCLMLIVEQLKGKVNIFTGDITNPDATEQKNKKQSIILLVARLLMSSLFLYIGILEVQRQIQTVGHWYSSSSTKGYSRPEGDGHDQLFFKLVQLAMSIPIAFGYSGQVSPVILSITLMLEALIQWRFWGIEIRNWRYYPIHARDHFFTNLAVAGGLLLLSGFGAGRYSIDSWLKKRD